MSINARVGRPGPGRDVTAFGSPYGRFEGRARYPAPAGIRSVTRYCWLYALATMQPQTQSSMDKYREDQDTASILIVLYSMTRYSK